MCHRFLLLAVLTMLVLSSFGTATSQTWINVTDLSGLDDGAVSLVRRPGGRVMIAGETFVSGEQQGLWMAVDDYGIPMWAKHYGGTGEDVLLGACEAQGGHYLVAGATNSPSSGAGAKDIWAILVDSQGRVIWERTYGGPGGDAGIAVSPIADGGFFVAGRTNDFSRSDFIVVRINAQGKAEWHKTYGLADESEYLENLIPTSDGGLILIGSTTYGEDYTKHALAIRIDNEGSIEWQRVYSAVGDDIFYSGEALADGGFVVVGRVQTNHSILPRAWMARLDTYGELVWNRAYPAESSQRGRFNEVHVAPEGGLIASGEHHPPGSQAMNAWIAEIDQNNGTILWQRSYGSYNLDWINDSVCTSDAGCFFAGSTRSFLAAGWDDLFLFRTDEQGEVSPDCEIEQTTNISGEDVPVVVEAYQAVEGTLEGFEDSPISLPVATLEGPREELCSGAALFPPGEVSPPESLAALVFTSRTNLEWEQASSSATEIFDLYRGDVENLPEGSTGHCLLSGLTSPQGTDLDLPPASSAWFYLVGGRNPVGRGPLGVATDGALREPETLCP